MEMKMIKKGVMRTSALIIVTTICMGITPAFAASTHCEKGTLTRMEIQEVTTPEHNKKQTAFPGKYALPKKDYNVESKAWEKACEDFAAEVNYKNRVMADRENYKSAKGNAIQHVKKWIFEDAKMRNVISAEFHAKQVRESSTRKLSVPIRKYLSEDATPRLKTNKD